MDKRSILQAVQQKRISPGEALKALQELSRLSKPIRDKDIAIVGMSGTFPGANNIDEFWDLLLSGKDAISRIPKSRWDSSHFYSNTSPEQTPSDKSYCDFGGFIDAAYSFDPTFFQISPKDAESMDPQERLFLQSCWHTFEDAGYTRERIQNENEKAPIGVYLGETTNNYMLHGPEQWERNNRIMPTTLPWSMANRVSYFFNLSGPSLTIDTACSSSLVALHQAVEAIRSGQIGSALVGGVNLYLHPSKYVWLSQMNMLSPSGKCHSFGEMADGFCPGEGILSILIKPLAEAVKAGDTIHGVIKGIAVNHDGKTTGFTVPNPQAQAALIKTALKDAECHPNDISFIEAHGTGTKLGDPIEIAGLNTAFASRTAQTPCNVSSAKANIGHLEAAAGLAGLIKVLLQMKHQTLAPSIHCETLNPNLDLSSNRVTIVKEKSDWTIPTVSKNRKRFAGLSSFGAGGVNAHVIIEEYPQDQVIHFNANHPQLILFSAHTEKSLITLLLRYKDHLSHKKTVPTLRELSVFTRVYKSALKYRVAIVATSITELCDTIEKRVKTKKFSQVTINNAPKRSIHSVDLYLLKSAWEQGDIDTIRFPHDPTEKPNISMPLYPFSQKEYRLSLREIETKTVKNHPLLGQNRSTVESFQFETTFTGDEFFLKDHTLWGKKTLPGVAYLEMAYQAYLHLTGKEVSCFKKVVWSIPYHFCQHDKTLRIECTPNTVGMDFRVTSAYADNEFVHATGSCYHQSEEIENPEFEESEIEYCSHNYIYNRFSEKELTYGTTFRPIDSIYKTKNGYRATLTLPQTEDRERYFLHPSLMDGALQSTIAAFDTSDTMLPLEIGEMHILGSVNQSTEVYTTKTSGQNGIAHFNCTIGEKSPLIVIKDFVLKTVNDSSDYSQEESLPITFLAPQWQPSDPHSFDFTKAILISSDPDNKSHNSWYELMTSKEFIPFCQERYKKEFADIPITIIYEYNKDVEITRTTEKLITIVRHLRKEQKAPIELIFYTTLNTPSSKSISGFLQTLSEELSLFSATHLTISKPKNNDPLSYVKMEVGHFHKMHRVRYIGDKREILTFVKFTPPTSTSTPIKEDKTYIVTGGFGRLGLLFSKYILEKKGKVVLLGRSSKGEIYSKHSELIQNELANYIDRFEYFSVDVQDCQKLNKTIENLPSTFQDICGVIHTAGINYDRLILQRKINDELLFNPDFVIDEDNKNKVLHAKVCGTNNLHEILSTKPLDFFILFSSISSVVGNSGQCDYATANAYMNSFATQQNQLAKDLNQKQIYKSILWPLWKEGGMRVSEDKERFFLDKWGMESISNTLGIKAFDRILQDSEHTCIIPFGGDYSKLKRNLYRPDKLVLMESNVVETSSVEITIANNLKTICAEMTGFDEEHISNYSSLEELGFDSIKITELTNKLNREYSLDLSVALFFEFLTIGELSTHLAENYSKNFTSVIIPQTEHEPPVREINTTPVTAAPQTTKEEIEGIAIVGMSGKFPGCKSPNELWDALLNKRDCITEVPKDRWDWQEYTDEGLPKWGGFIDGIREFDPLFFGISPAEAKLMDPQQRLVLEAVWKTIEDSGHKASELENTKTGIYLGVSVNDYAELMEKNGVEIKAQSSIGSVHSMIANRVSYLLNLRGPSESIDTACSSSLVALHRAVQDIENGNAEMALVGGVNAILSPKLNRSFNKAGMLSPDGRCKPFDAAANGYVRSEGVGIIFLKPLKKAVEDGDHIYAKIVGTHVNHGGKAKSLTAPNPKAQTELLLEAYEKAKVPFSSISYLETHGTGTALGDPIEIHGLSNVAKMESSKEHQCVLGSIKANVGHLESAAGITGVIKVLLAMQHKTIPGTPHLNTMNPKIQLTGTPFSFAEDTIPWKTQALPRRAGVNSFGFGGVNAHVILEEVEQVYEQASYTEDLLFPFSAKSKESLHAIIRQFIQLLSQNTETTSDLQLNRAQLINITAETLNLPEAAIDLQLPPIDLGITKESATEIIQKVNRSMNQSFSVFDLIESPTLAEFCTLKSSINHTPHRVSIEQLAYTLQVGREQLSHRVAVVANSYKTLLEELTHILQRLSSNQNNNRNYRETDIKVAIEKREIHTIRKLWMKGATIPFEELYNTSSLIRASLPTYEFSGKQYWFDEEQVIEDNSLLNRIMKIISLNTCYNGVVTDSTTINNLQLDSLQVVSLIHALSSEFEKRINLSTISLDSPILSIVSKVTTNNNQSLGNSFLVDKTFFEELYRESFRGLKTYTIERKLTSLDCYMEVLIAGKGDPVLFLNGLGMTFASLHKAIEELSIDHTVYCINYPGTGLSDTIDKPIIVEEICKAIISILDSYNVESFDLMGWSMGGFLAQYISENYPNRVKTVTLINSSNYFEGEYEIEEVYQMLQLVDRTYLDQVVHYQVSNPELYRKISVGTHNIKETFKAFEFVYNFNKSKKQFDISSPTLLLTNGDDPIISSKHSYAINNHLLNKGITTMIKEFKAGSHYIPMFETKDFVSIFRTFKKRAMS